MYLEDEEYNDLEGAVTFYQGDTVVGSQVIPAGGAGLDGALMLVAETLVFHSPGYKDYSVPSSLISEGDNRLMMITRENLFIPFILGLVGALIFAFSDTKK